jgi:hypothetical protein
MSTVPPDLSQAIENSGVPLRLTDPRTKSEYVIIRADVYDRLRSLFEDDYDPLAAAALFWNVMKEDWEDPSMDEYDHYPETP